MVDARKAGQAPFEITCLDATYMPVNVEVKDNRDGTFSCRYLPKNPIKHTVVITWGPVAIPNSPFRVSFTVINILLLFVYLSFILYNKVVYYLHINGIFLIVWPKRWNSYKPQLFFFQYSCQPRLCPEVIKLLTC